MSRTRGTWNSKGMWAAGVVLAGVIGLTTYAVLDGDDDGARGNGPAKPTASASASGPSAVPTITTPDDWTEPERWAALPRGSKTDSHGSQVGFPHTTEGAVAMMAAANNTDIEGTRSNQQEQRRIYDSYISPEDQSSAVAEKIEAQARATDDQLRQTMGVGKSQPLPSGAYVRNTVIAYKVIKSQPDEVSVWLAASAAQKNGETEKESVNYLRLLMAARWVDGDWKLSANATADVMGTKPAKPSFAPPGDPKFNSLGWTAIRSAS
ncbi:hypothetical protein ACIPWL_31735 [Streptomyces sp. NPDC090023]|uniref:hypothetical protein n=1 Tax=unclassified Streptomyces TaxID=2593676 RepID=UPI0037F36CD1